MFASISDSLAKTEAVFEKLRERAEQRPPELTREWFDQALFKTRSNQVSAYLDEAETNARRLAEVPPDSPVFNIMNEIVQEQLTALVQALYRG
ncbi:Primosomal replication protein priB and priC [Idiomarina sp. A28L]|uniref:primosomal replication protein PriC n=1 Tax=Idiomarina sp. A28L TaxID=1036674 RepID=UPI0002138D72|nr:primosomal replication protein PriC [Idiomarina sp. A28L]EGN74442.1 Primosomal replication protein priB and priC [Idiomarina sp. A28L]